MTIVPFNDDEEFEVELALEIRKRRIKKLADHAEREDLSLKDPSKGFHLHGNGEILSFVPLQKFMAKNHAEGGWLVEGIWDRNAFGFWAGEFKAYKTWTVLDLAVSVALNVPFLGKYEVHRPGRVLYLHEEGKPDAIQDQIHRILASKGGSPSLHDGTWGTNKHIDIASMQEFNITEAEHRDRLVNYIKVHRPVLVILEAWYLISGGVNEDKAQEVTPLTNWLMRLAQAGECSIVVSHHYNKGSGQGVREGNRMSGSGVFARSFESAVYLERKGEENDFMVEMQTQHRGQIGIKQILKFQIDRTQPDDYAVSFLDAVPSDDTDPDSMDPYEYLIVGEMIDLNEATTKAGCTTNAMRSRVKKNAFLDTRRIKGVTYVVRIQ